MKTKAVRMYGADDLRLEEFELPEIKENEILLRVITDSLCTSTYNAVKLGEKYRSVPNNISDEPVIIGHEMCGEIAEVGKELSSEWRVGEKVIVLPDMRFENEHALGYSFKFIGGAATYVIVPADIISTGCLIRYELDSFFSGSLVEPLACAYRASRAFYHADEESGDIIQGPKKSGRLLILGGAGPLGMAAVEILKKCASVSEIVVVDVSEERLDFSKRRGALSDNGEGACKVTYLNTANVKNPKETLLELSDGGFDDVLVMSSKSELFILAENVCREDGCINFFASPLQKDAYAQTNLYKLHYNRLHIVGSTGSTASDAKEIIRLIKEKIIDPAIFISHIVGINDCIEATMELQKASGAKKICYTGIDIPYIAVEELSFWGESDTHYRALAEIVEKNGGLWCDEAEKYLLENAPRA